MAWSDIFIPSGNQTYDEAQANIERQKAARQAQIDRQLAAGEISPQEAAASHIATSGIYASDQNAAAVEGFKLGLPKWLGGDGHGGSDNGPGFSIPLWVWLAMFAFLFVWMGGLPLIKGILKKKAA